MLVLEEQICKKMEEGGWQRFKIVIKRMQKFQHQIDQCQKLILRSKISEPVDLLIQIIKAQVETNRFMGVGNPENWMLYFSKGPSQWFSHVHANQLNGNPFDLLIITFMILIHENAVSIADALSIYTDILETLPHRYELQAGRGHIYYQSQQFLKAQECYEQVLYKCPKPQKILQSMGWVQYKFDRKVQTLKYCKKCLQINPTNRFAMLLKILSIEHQQYSAVQDLEDMAIRYPEYYRIFMQLGVIETNFSKKQIWFSKAMSFEPNCAEITARKAYQIFLQAEKVLQANGDQAQIQSARYQTAAISLAQQALAMDSCSQAYHVLTEVVYYRSNYKKSHQHLQNNIKKNPFDFKAYYKIGILSFQHLKKADVAIKNFKRSIQLNPFSLDTYKDIGASYFQAYKDTHQAEKYFLKAIEIDPNYQAGLGQMGKIDHYRKNYVKALEWYARAYQAKLKEDYCYGIADSYYRLIGVVMGQKMSGIIVRRPQITFLWIIIDVELRRKRYKDALWWSLRSLNQSKDLSNRLIFKRILSPLEIQTAKNIVRQVDQLISKQPSNIYCLIILASICSKLEMKQDSYKLYTLASVLHNQSYVSDDIEEVLVKAAQRE